VNVLSDTWTDFDGDQPYGDYTVTGVPGSRVVTNVRSYDLAMGSFAWSSGSPDASTVSYDHRDMIGTMRGNSGSSGTGMMDPVFTAFGERKSGTPTRFAYAGAHGYQTDESTFRHFPFLHLGTRYYDPRSGRFLQRDTIGIRGGVNVYTYVRNLPTIAIDPIGLDFTDDVGTGAAVGGAIGGGIGGAIGAPGGLIPLGAGAVAGAGAGAAAGTLCGAGYWLGRHLTPLVDWLYSDDFEDAGNSPAPGSSGSSGGLTGPGIGVGCFVAGTMVTTGSDETPIEGLGRGDLVLSFDERRMTCGVSSVVSV